MATVHYTAVLAIIIVLQLQAYVANADPFTFTTPALPPIPGRGGVCQGPVCGRGTCVQLQNSTLGFECECEPGWRQALPQQTQFPNFLPCLIPDCVLNFTCIDADHPPGEDPRTRTISLSDPCTWADCGGGRCTAISQFTRTCECEEGYSNLLNSTNFPCYRICAFGENCASLGVNTSTSIVNPFFPVYNQAARLMNIGEPSCLITMGTAFVGAVVLKYI